MAIWPFRRRRKGRRPDRRVTVEGAPTREMSVESRTRPRPRTGDDGLERGALAKELEIEPGTPVRARDPRAPLSAVAADPSTSAVVMEPHKETRVDKEVDVRDEIPSYYFLNPTSTASLASPPRVSLAGPPTLRAKRPAHDSGIPRRASSKKKKRDHAREQEIRAMSDPNVMPSRPWTHAGGTLRRDFTMGYSHSDRSLVRRNQSNPAIRRPERPRSHDRVTYSGPPSTFFPVMERPMYTVKTFDMFSPRPTLHCWDAAQSFGGSSSGVVSRSDSRRQRPAQLPPLLIPDALMRDNRRVDDLADRLDAGGIRELLERDRRRRERKRKAEELRLQRRLERQAEKQQREEEEENRGAARGLEGTSATLPSGGDLAASEGQASRPVSDDTSTGFDPGGPSRNPRTSDHNPSPLSWLQDPSVERLPRAPTEASSVPPHGSPAGERSLTDDHEEPVIGTATAIRLSQASMSPPSSPRHALLRPTSNISEVTDPFRESTASTLEPMETDLRGSMSSVRGGAQTTGSWMSFFRRSGTRNKADAADTGRRTPSEFSNTSRDSLSRQPLPPSVRTSFQRKSGAPVRTTSKFREELPELPVSPPDSRLQSPETAPVAGPPADAATLAPTDSTSINTFNLAASPTMSHPLPPTEVTSQSPTEAVPAPVLVQRQRSVDAPSIEGKAATVMSQSMASIDSEGSWLSGKPAKRSSQNPMFSQRHSAGSLQRRFQDFSDSGGEELGVAEDEYFSRLTPGLEVSERSAEMRKASSTAIASSESEGEDDDDDDDDDNGGELPDEKDGQERRTWRGGVARHPTVIHHTSRAKSREGLLNDYQNEENPRVGGDLGDSPESDVRSFELPIEEMAPSPKGAGNVDQGTRQHLRHISAGSARLLEIAPRSSGENRRSIGSTTQSTKGG